MARIALLYSGLPRQWQPCIASQLALFKDHAVDVFCHFWDYVDDVEKARLREAYKPKAYRFEKQVDFTQYEKLVTVTDNINPPSRMMSMYYSWKSVLGLFDDYCRTSGTQYDYAVRIRTDLMFFNAIDHILAHIGPKDLVISQHNNFNLINDMFAVGGVEPIRYYHTLFDRALEYGRIPGMQFNPELLLIQHLKANPHDFRFIMSDLVMLVFRPHMVGMSIEECLQEHPGRSKWKDPEIVDWHKGFHGRRDGQKGIEHVEMFKTIQLRDLENSKRKPQPQFFYRKPGS